MALDAYVIPEREEARALLRPIAQPLADTLAELAEVLRRRIPVHRLGWDPLAPVLPGA